MDFKQLESFSVLASELHFANAARRCHITASALTRSIQRLEDELGVELLLRNNRRVELTAAGKTFAEYASEALEQWYKVRHSLHSDSISVSGQLQIFSSVTASYSVLSLLLTEFRQKFPQVEIQLHTGDQAEAIDRVLAGSEQISIAALPETLPSSIAFKTLTFSPLRFIMPAGHGDIAEQITQLRDVNQGVLSLAELPMIISEHGLARKRLDDWLKKSRTTPNIYAQVSGHEAIVSMVALGFGIGLVPDLVIQHSPLSDKIRVIEDAPELPVFQIGLCALQSSLLQPAVKAFWDSADPMIFK